MCFENILPTVRERCGSNSVDSLYYLHSVYDLCLIYLKKELKTTKTYM